MAKFVQLKDTNGDVIFLNPDHVVAIERSGANECAIRTTMSTSEKGKVRFFIAMAAAEVASKLGDLEL